MRLIIGLFIFILAGCATAGNSSTSASGTGGADAGPRLGPPVEVATPDYTVAPGKEVRFQCFALTLPSAIDVIKIEPRYGAGVHHLVAWTTLATEPEGAFACPELVKTTWLPVYTGGKATTPLVMPPGTAVHFVAGQQLLIQLHILNTSAAPITDHAGLVLTTSLEPSLIPAGFWGSNNEAFAIPALAKDYQVEQECPAPHDMHVFAVFGHEHTLGTKFEFFLDSTATKPVFSEPWVFDDQPTTLIDLFVAKDQKIITRCTYTNPGAADVPYGESTFEEMCAGVMYYWPYPGFQGCIKPPGQP